MATTFDQLPAADQADLSRKLALYGLNESSFLQADLFVPSGATVTLSSGSDSFLRPYILTTSDVNELKRWIGTPNRYFEKGYLKNSYHLTKNAESTLHKLQNGATPGAITSKAELEAVHSTAMAYIWGDSSKMESIKPALDTLFGRYQIVVWPFLTITVAPGAVLQLGPGASVLCAWKIIIEEGGQVRGSGPSLTVQCTILQKKFIEVLPFPGTRRTAAANL